MRPVEYKTEDIIKTGLELQVLGLKVSGFSIRKRIGGGNTKRLEQVWDEYQASQTGEKAEPTTELPLETAEYVMVEAKNINEWLLGLAIKLNDKAIKAAECRIKEDSPSANDQREQELTDAQAVIQSQTMELTKLQERLDLAEQTSKSLSEQYAAELERLRNELIEQKHANQILMAKNDEAHKQTAVLKATNAPTAEPMAKHPNQQTWIIGDDKLLDIKTDKYRFVSRPGT
jgi:hypothetical protein